MGRRSRGCEVRRAPGAARRPQGARELPTGTLGMDRSAIGYACVAVAADSELNSRSATITAGCRERGLRLARIVHDVEASERPSLAWALEQLEQRPDDALVVARLGDLAPSVARLAPLLAWFAEQRRTLIALDFGLDTSTEAGRLAAREIAGIGRRTARAHRGQPSVVDIPELHDRIAAMRAQGTDAAGDRGRAERRRRADAARRRAVAPVERPARVRLPAPVERRPRHRAARSRAARALGKEPDSAWRRDRTGEYGPDAGSDCGAPAQGRGSQGRQ